MKIKQACLNTTLMGVLRGVADYFGIDASTPALFGGTGVAFLINIHNEICPSGPYCWNMEPFHCLLRNLGIEMRDRGFFSAESRGEARAEAEEILKNAIDEGVPCSLVNMEHQLITGYDDSGFSTAQPWAPAVDFPPARLSFGSWAELGSEIHMGFHTYHRVAPADAVAAASAAVAYAIDLRDNPNTHSSAPYAAGPSAYSAWITAVNAGHGGDHGNWWNATVWSECRRHAAGYLRELGEAFPTRREELAGAAVDLEAVSEYLAKAADKELNPPEKRRVLEFARETELRALDWLERCLPLT